MKKLLIAGTAIAILAAWPSTAGAAALQTQTQAAYTCDGKPATIVGTSGNNTLNGGVGDDVIVGLGGNDTINGRGGNDTICAGSGNDTVHGGTGNDELYSGTGVDSLYGDSGNDTVIVWDGSNSTIDLADGGSGYDACASDSVDTVVNCEPVAT